MNMNTWYTKIIIFCGLLVSTQGCSSNSTNTVNNLLQKAQEVSHGKFKKLYESASLSGSQKNEFKAAIEQLYLREFTQWKKSSEVIRLLILPKQRVPYPSLITKNGILAGIALVVGLTSLGVLLTMLIKGTGPKYPLEQEVKREELVQVFTQWGEIKKVPNPMPLNQGNAAYKTMPNTLIIKLGLLSVGVISNLMASVCAYRMKQAQLKLVAYKRLLRLRKIKNELNASERLL